MAEACPWSVLGIARGSKRKEIKQRFYELAKTMHPDVVQAALKQEGVDADEEEIHGEFVRITSAFEACLDDLESEAAFGAARATAPSAAARGGARSTRRRQAPRMVRHKDGIRTKSLGEILCEDLREDPVSAMDVWEDILAQHCDVRESMLDELFRACAASGAGLTSARSILRDATRRGLITKAVREAGVVSLIKWCKEDADSFRAILAEVDEQEKTPETLEMLSNANFLYSGYADGYNIKRED